MTDADLNSAAKALFHDIAVARMKEESVIPIIHRHFTALSEAMEKRVQELEGDISIYEARPYPAQVGKLFGTIHQLRRSVKELQDQSVAMVDENLKLRTERDQLTATLETVNKEWLPGHDELCRRAEKLSDDLHAVTKERDQLAGQVKDAREAFKIIAYATAGVVGFPATKAHDIAAAQLTSLRAQLAKGGGE